MSSFAYGRPLSSAGGTAERSLPKELSRLPTTRPHDATEREADVFANRLTRVAAMGTRRWPELRATHGHEAPAFHRSVRTRQRFRG
jgi:hypothetical protein